MAFANPGANVDLQSSKVFDVSHVVAVVTGGGSMLCCKAMYRIEGTHC